MDRRILFLKQKIIKNLPSEFSIEELAEEVNLSPSYLHALFKAETDQTPKHFICALRLEKACNLLETTFKQIKEICFEVGFSNQAVFTRTFKKK